MAGKPGRHKGTYIPAKDRPLINGATDHSAWWDGVGSRSKRFPELERASQETSPARSSRRPAAD